MSNMIVALGVFAALYWLYIVASLSRTRKRRSTERRAYEARKERVKPTIDQPIRWSDDGEKAREHGSLPR